jgi:hypothetical protein
MDDTELHFGRRFDFEIFWRRHQSNFMRWPAHNSISKRESLTYSTFWATFACQGAPGDYVGGKLIRRYVAAAPRLVNWVSCPALTSG